MTRTRYSRLLEKIGDFDAVCGWRQKRNDNFIRRISSRIAKWRENRLSGETIRDVGCSLKAFRSVYAKKDEALYRQCTAFSRR